MGLTDKTERGGEKKESGRSQAGYSGESEGEERGLSSPTEILQKKKEI